jgi:thioredoxin reductase (NADPH)
MYDVIIIGAGPAGLTAGLYAGRRGLSVLILEKQLAAGQLCKAYRIENYPGFPEGIAGFELAEKMLECSKKAGCEIEYEGVVGLETQQQIYRIQTQNNIYQSRAVIISTGLKPKMLNIPGEDRLIGRGVSYCATCDGPLFKAKDVVVIGGGNQALCDAVYLSIIKCNVTLIHRREEFRASADVIEQFKKSNIKTFLWHIPEQIIGDNKVEYIAIKSVQTNQTTKLKTDAVFVHIGAEPETKLFSFLKLDENGYIITDKNFQTSQEGIFACGDVRSGSLKQIISACGEGASAGWNASARIQTR